MNLLATANKAIRHVLVAQGARSEVRFINGHAVHHYHLKGEGSGPPVLLLHGLGSSANAYYRTLAPLSRRFSDVWAIDLPGNGFSPMPDVGPLPVRELVKVAVAFQEQVIKAPVFLIGNSLGGAMSLYAAHEAPKALKALALISPAGAKLSDAHVDGLKKSFTVTNTAEARAMTKRLFHKAPLPFLLFASELKTLYMQPTVTSVLQEVQASDYVTEEMLAALAMPTLLIWGQSEKLLPYESLAYFRANLPKHAEIEEVKDFGHMPQMEAPSEVVRRLIGFAERQRLL